MKKIFSRSRFSTTFFPGLPAIFRVVCVTVLLIGIAGCPDEKPVDPPPTNPLQLTVEDVTCTEASLKLSLAGSEKNRSVVLKRSDSTIAAITIASNDSLFVDEGLLPNKTYTYKLTYGDWIATAQATTMDTTSHDWTWQIDTLGTSASVLVDVAIVNDTLVYAVGEIHTKDTDRFDSLGNWVAPYNVAKWDGKKWNLIQLKWNCRLYYPNCGPETMLFSPATSVFAFGPNDVWISSGSVHHFDGTKWTEEAGILGAGSANKIWGNPVVGLYFVGNNGFIAHRSANGTWQKIESGTTLPIEDIWGDYNGKTKKNEIYAVASYPFQSNEKRILKISETNISSISDSGIIYPLSSIWFKPGLQYYVAGGGIYEKHHLSDIRWANGPLDITSYYIYSIRGNELNDVIAAGGFGEVIHFNGITWQSYKQLRLSNGNYESVAIKGNLTIAAGWYGQSSRAVVAVGKR
jgi:hypothetical protein